MILIRTLTLVSVLAFSTTIACGDVITFDDLSLNSESNWHGPDPNGTVVTGKFGTPVTVGEFESGGATFINRYDNTFGNWSGFAYSNMTDTTTQTYFNQYSALTRPAQGNGSNIYGVAYDDGAMNPTSAADLWTLPSFTLPDGVSIEGMSVTNTTYAGLTMLNGDPNGFAKKFGGDSGNDPDWFKLTAYGIDALGNPLSNAVEFYLADYRYDDNSLDYVLDDWSFFDLSLLDGARSLHFDVTSSDVGAFGTNTPAYFAMDNVQFAPTAAVPEPASALLLAGSFLGAGLWGRFRGRMKAKC